MRHPLVRPSPVIHDAMVEARDSIALSVALAVDGVQMENVRPEQKTAVGAGGGSSEKF